MISALLLRLLLKPALEQYSKGHKAAFGPSLNDIEKRYGKDVRDKIEASTHTYGVSGPGSGFSAKLRRGGGIRIKNGACGPNGVL